MSNLFKRAITGSILVVGIIAMLFLGFRVFTLFTMVLGLGLSAELDWANSSGRQAKKDSQNTHDAGLCFSILNLHWCCWFTHNRGAIGWPLLILVGGISFLFSACTSSFTEEIPWLIWEVIFSPFPMLPCPFA